MKAFRNPDAATIQALYTLRFRYEAKEQNGMNAHKIALAFAGVTLVASFAAPYPSLAEDANPFDGN